MRADRTAGGAESELARRRARSGDEHRALPDLQHRQQPAGGAARIRSSCSSRRSDARPKRNLLPMQPGDVPATYADVDDLMRDVGFRPATPIEEGVGRFVAWYREFLSHGIDRRR